MPDIRKNSGVVTQITTVKLPHGKQDEVLDLMKERPFHGHPARLPVDQSASQQGWRPRRQLHPVERCGYACSRPSLAEFRKKWPWFGEIAEEIEPCLYDLVQSEAA